MESIKVNKETDKNITTKDIMMHTSFSGQTYIKLQAKMLMMQILVELVCGLKMSQKFYKNIKTI